ncbi:unnamed protein product [Pieris brassicae]|uniref:Uncharacterized protein n=1 Tax=Pieris brassicae TaxID=7116 RepID=A0A9P0WZK2_PIEBR|nr:unnamed protein product [Pieris brassicae]
MNRKILQSVESARAIGKMMMVTYCTITDFLIRFIDVTFDENPLKNLVLNMFHLRMTEELKRMIYCVIPNKNNLESDEVEVMVMEDDHESEQLLDGGMIG